MQPWNVDLRIGSRLLGSGDRLVEAIDHHHVRDQDTVMVEGKELAALGNAFHEPSDGCHDSHYLVGWVVVRIATGSSAAFQPQYLHIDSALSRMACVIVARQVHSVRGKPADVTRVAGTIAAYKGSRVERRAA